MNRFNAVVAVAALALGLCTLGCQNPQQEEAATQTPELVTAAPEFPRDQIPEAEQVPVEPAQPALVETPEPDYATHEITTIEPEPAPAPVRTRTTTAKPKERYAAPKPAARTYVVKKGDTLQKISKQFYGTTRNYMKIYQANKSKLKDPNKLPVGTKLVIP
ncbi:MAG TPA: LysM peptidoglycan-binding domain-containing protein [Phycisphaerae bacterium]|nr:LysM peptidoglycan-binding domain-containing protein [Phycisphaerae bacterium]